MLLHQDLFILGLSFDELLVNIFVGAGSNQIALIFPKLKKGMG
jgi:hypothetical protein